MPPGNSGVATFAPHVFDAGSPSYSSLSTRRFVPRKKTHAPLLFGALGLAAIASLGVIAYFVVQGRELPWLGDLSAKTPSIATKPKAHSEQTQFSGATEQRDQIADDQVQRNLEAARAREESERLQQQNDDQIQRERQALRKTILEQLGALPEKEQREVDELLALISELNVHVVDVEQYLRQLQSKILGLQVDIQLGKAVGVGGSGIGTSRQQVLNQLNAEHRNYLADLARSGSVTSLL